MERITGFQLLPCKGLFFATGLRRIPSQGAALAVAAKTHDKMVVYRVLAQPNDSAENGSGNDNRDDGPVGACGACLQVKEKRHVLMWTDGPGKTGGNGVGDEDLDLKSGDESDGRRGALQSEKQEQELE